MAPIDPSSYRTTAIVVGSVGFFGSAVYGIIQGVRCAVEDGAHNCVKNTTIQVVAALALTAVALSFIGAVAFYNKRQITQQSSEQSSLLRAPPIA